MSNYIIGIDGGGTKTYGVLWDNNQKIIKTYQSGFSNFNVDYNKSKENLEDVINNLSDNISSNLKIVIGLSGKSGLKNSDKYINELENKYKAKVAIVDDGLLAMNSLIRNSKVPGIIVISGTGSILYGLNNKKLHTVGGFGHILGDYGSSYHLVIESFKHTINYYEKHNKLDEFSKKLFDKLKITEINELKRIVYDNKKSKIASYAKDIDCIANKNNDVAIKLLEKEAEYLVQQFENMINKIELNKTVKVGLVGSFINKSKIVNKYFLRKINKYDVEIIKNINPVDGAIYIADKLGENDEKNI